MIGLALLLLAGTPVGRAFAEDFAGPETCAACHAQEYADWRGSVHSRALSAHFKKIWKESGSKASCLACLAILVWHFYLVIFDLKVYPMNMAWLIGKIRRRRKPQKDDRSR